MTVVVLAGVGLYLWAAMSAGWSAQKKGKNYTLFCLFGLLCPLVANVVASVMSPDEESKARSQLSTGVGRKCPYCAEIIKAEAQVCRFCRADLSPAPIPDVPGSRHRRDT
jgi:hypothetical protein